MDQENDSPFHDWLGDFGYVVFVDRNRLPATNESFKKILAVDWGKFRIVKAFSLEKDDDSGYGSFQL